MSVERTTVARPGWLWQSSQPREGSLIWFARGLWLLCLFLGAISAYVGLTDPRATALNGLGGVGPLGPAIVGVVGLVDATAGLLILRQRVRHTVGWLLILSGLTIAFVFAAQMLG